MLAKYGGDNDSDIINAANDEVAAFRGMYRTGLLFREAEILDEVVRELDDGGGGGDEILLNERR